MIISLAVSYVLAGFVCAAITYGASGGNSRIALLAGVVWPVILLGEALSTAFEFIAHWARRNW